MSDDDPQRGSPYGFHEIDGVRSHGWDFPMEWEYVRADRVAYVEGDGVKTWSSEGSSAPQPPGVRECVTDAEYREGHR